MRAKRTTLLLLCGLPMLGACERTSPGDDAPSNGTAVTNAWERDSVSSHIVLTKDAANELSASIEAAQASANQARQQFLDAMPHDRLRFAVLWMSPTVDGAREFVWVRPLEWSPFRIEGVMLSEPTAALESGTVKGELASFAIEELADWVILDAKRPGHAVEGATTLRELEQRIGTPSPTTD